MNTEEQEDKIVQSLSSVIRNLVLVIIVLLVALIAMPFIIQHNYERGRSNDKTLEGRDNTSKQDNTVYWQPLEISTITDTKQTLLVEYGKDLIGHTAKYLGPNGSVLTITNGMNCQNCHLQAGTAVFGNNYGSVASLYPKFRARSGSIENIYKRVNDCLERSLNGKAIDTAGKEMQAIVAYINFLGTNVEKGKKAQGSGFKDLPFLDRAADPMKGQTVYTTKCQSCHQVNGGGLLNIDKTEYTYPPLWGKNSFNDGAHLLFAEWKW